MALNNVWRVRFGYEIGGFGGRPYEHIGTPEKTVDVIAALVASENRPTQASIITVLNAQGYGVPSAAPTGTVLVVRNIAPANTPTAYGTPATGTNYIWRVRWRYEVGGRFLQQFGTIMADFISIVSAAQGAIESRPDTNTLLAQIAANFTVPSGAAIVIESAQSAANITNLN